MSTRKPFTAVIKMSPLYCSSSEQETVKLDVSLSDLTLENWAWAKVVDSFIHPEEGYFLIVIFSVASTISNQNEEGFRIIQFQQAKCNG